MIKKRDKQEKVLAIVFHDGRPFSVTTTEWTYDVELCKADGTLYFHKSGGAGVNGNSVWLEGGRESDYWLARRFEPSFNPGVGEGNRLQRVNPKWLRLPETWGCESDTVYCKICEDCIPIDNVSVDACDHIHWDADAGEWKGEGYER